MVVSSSLDRAASQRFFHVANFFMSSRGLPDGPAMAFVEELRWLRGRRQPFDRIRHIRRGTRAEPPEKEYGTELEGFATRRNEELHGRARPFDDFERPATFLHHFPMDRINVRLSGLQAAAREKAPGLFLHTRDPTAIIENDGVRGAANRVLHARLPNPKNSVSTPDLLRRHLTYGSCVFDKRNPRPPSPERFYVFRMPNSLAALLVRRRGMKLETRGVG
jgi:hypothetical protein